MIGDEIETALARGELPKGIRGVALDLEHVRRHDLRPPHVHHVRTDRGRIPQPLTYPRPSPTPHLRVDAFGQALHDTLQNNVVGYAMQLRQEGTPVFSMAWRDAHTTADGHEPMTTKRRMHVASVSKLVTAIAMQRVLDETNTSPDTPIIRFLPGYWAKGPNVDRITFRHLMTHTSGFVTGHSDESFPTMKQQVANGVPRVGYYSYENMNFGLCRILLAVLKGNIVTGFHTRSPFLDTIWDITTTSAYTQYVTAHVLAPAGVSAVLVHEPTTALAYVAPMGDRRAFENMVGWNSGDLHTQAGGVGWHMSVEDILAVMATARRGTAILRDGDAFLANSFGIDDTTETPAGPMYDKDGMWQGNCRAEQCVVFFLPDDMELAVFVNSQITNEEDPLKVVVRKLLAANIW